MSKCIFITGTGTDVGKTYVTGLLLKKLKEEGMHAAYYKAAMSGNLRDEQGELIPGDAKFVRDSAGISQPLSDMCPYIYETAVSPHLASRLEGNPVQLDVVKKGFEEVCRTYDYVVMEGSGGIVCPINWDGDRILLEDILRELGNVNGVSDTNKVSNANFVDIEFPSLLIADAGLGTINSVVLTAEYMRARNLPIRGIIFNHFHPGNVMEEDNLRMCERMTGIPVIACVQDGDAELAISSERLKSIFE